MREWGGWGEEGATGKKKKEGEGMECHKQTEKEGKIVNMEGKPNVQTVK